MFIETILYTRYGVAFTNIIKWFLPAFLCWSMWQNVDATKNYFKFKFMEMKKDMKNWMKIYKFDLVMKMMMAPVASIDPRLLHECLATSIEIYITSWHTFALDSLDEQFKAAINIYSLFERDYILKRSSCP